MAKVSSVGTPENSQPAHGDMMASLSVLTQASIPLSLHVLLVGPARCSARTTAWSASLPMPSRLSLLWRRGFRVDHGKYLRGQHRAQGAISAVDCLHAAGPDPLHDGHVHGIQRP